MTRCICRCHHICLIALFCWCSVVIDCGRVWFIASLGYIWNPLCASLKQDNRLNKHSATLIIIIMQQPLAKKTVSSWIFWMVNSSHMSMPKVFHNFQWSCFIDLNVRKKNAMTHFRGSSWKSINQSIMLGKRRSSEAKGKCNVHKKTWDFYFSISYMTLTFRRASAEREELGLVSRTSTVCPPPLWSRVKYLHSIICLDVFVQTCGQSLPLQGEMWLH